MDVRRVVITGLGCISSLGRSADETWEGIVSNRVGIRVVDEFADFPVAVYARAVTHEPADLVGAIPPATARKLTLPMLLFFAAVKEAVASAQLESHSGSGIGIIAGTTANYPVEVGLDDLLDYYACACNQRIDWAKYLDSYPYSHHHFFQHTTNLLTCFPAIYFGYSGINQTLHNACASGTQAVGEAYRAVKTGHANIILAGGAEALVNVAGATALTKLGLLSTQRDPAIACRPFDLERDGLVLGEGAAVLVVESLESAQARSAPILAEIVGFGSSANAYRITDSPIDGRGASFAIIQCLREAGVTPAQIDVISAHATSTKQNDISETNAIKRALGDYATQIPVCALKAFVGHALSAAGAIELVAAVYTLQTNIIPHIPSYRTADPECDLNVVRQPYQAESIQYLLKNSFGFGGQNGSLLLKKSAG